MINECKESSQNNCGLFDFMANTIGIKVLHPGGYSATKKLCTNSNLAEDSNVLDVACGAGSTSFYLAQKYKCNITGIDISESLIHQAKSSLNKSRYKDKIRFDVANALQLPFADNTFDFVISQAFFILINEKDQALNEIYRVLKPGGYMGSLELSWFKQPSKEIFNELMEKACNDFIPRVKLFEEWEGLFESKFSNHINTDKNPMTSGMLQMLKAEGLPNFIKIMGKMMGNSEYKNRMMKVQNVFCKYDEYLGFGLYVYKK